MVAANDLRWNLSKQPHLGIAAALGLAHNADHVRRSEDEHHLRLYSEREWSLYQSTDVRAGIVAAHRARKKRRLALNVVKNNIDAWQNLICRSRPHITYLTKGADWGLQKKARLRTRFVEAHFLKRKLYDKANLVAKHAGIFGSGFIHVVKDFGRIDYEVVMPGELVVDPREALADDPRTFYRERRGGIDLRVAQELWPQHAKRLEHAPRLGNSNRIPYVDAWHLPSGPDADDGMHAQVIPGFLTLSTKPYKWDAPPIVQLRFDDAPIGWFGSGIAEELSGIQFEINSVLRTIQSNIYMGGNLKLGIPKGSSVAPSQLSNALGCPTFEFTGEAPVWIAHDVVSANLFQHLANLRREASEIIGISQMNAESTTPFASMSGRARLVHDQSYSKRFVTHQGRYEDFFCDLSERTLEAAADLADDDEDIEIIFPGRNMLEQVKYSDVAGKRDDFDAQAWSASMAGESPAGRLEQISEMMSMGMIDLAGAMYLYEIPHDLRAHMEEVLAPIELAREAIDKIIEDGIPMTPTPQMDLRLAAKTSQLWYQRGILREADTQKLHMLLDFQKMALWLLARANAQPANANGQPQGGRSQLSGVTLPVAPAPPAQMSA